MSEHWTDAAAREAVAFAQVREDALLDLEVVERLGRSVRMIMIASGGCTAAAVAASARVSHLHLVDVNPVQMALCRLKVHLAGVARPEERRGLLGHDPMNSGERLNAVFHRLEEIGSGFELIEGSGSLTGLDRVGRYEILFEELRRQMGRRAWRWLEILPLADAAERSAIVAPETEFGRAMDAAFDEVMALPNLIKLFGAAATQNAVEPFSRHFARRTRHAIATMPTKDNPYLWQMLLGRFPDGVAYPWIHARRPKQMPEIVQTVGTMDRALEGRDGQFDFVHLSNILDWLSPAEAGRTLELAWRALRPGGYVFVRQLNSTLDLPALGLEFEWLKEEADEMHRRDRSFFYRRLHLGRRA
jgi:S-adenosylmethionine-diacylglycerol 3-amino-3-carboxypropyl transferase